MGSAYAIILPSVEALESDLGLGKGAYEQVRGEEIDVRESEEIQRTPSERGPSIDENAAILAVSPHASIFEEREGENAAKEVKLSLQDKIQLIKPMLTVFILPLVLVYFFE